MEGGWQGEAHAASGFFNLFPLASAYAREAVDGVVEGAHNEAVTSEL